MSQIAQILSTKTFYDTVRQASDALADGITDVIEVYNDALDHTGFGLIAKGSGDYTIRGVKKADGKYPLIASFGVNDSNVDRLTYGKAIYNFEGPICRFQNMTLRGAQVSDNNGGNGAGIRINQSVTAFYGNNFKCIDNQNGILANTPNGEIVLEDFVLEHNGYGRQGYTHNIYAGDAKSLTMRRATVINSQYGHDIKSRAKETRLYQVHAEGSANGRELDLSNGGILYAENCEFIKHSDAAQNNLIHLAPEGISDGRPEKYELVNCLFQIDIPLGRALQFINNSGGVECVLTDPLFMLNGAKISDAEAAPLLVGNVRIVLTGGKRGPLLPTGCHTDIVDAGGAASVPTPDAPRTATPAPTPVPVSQPVPTPVPVSQPVPTPVPARTSVETWTKIGDEGSLITGTAGQHLRYGINGLYVLKTLAVGGSYTASNEFFGSDPVPGVAKIVELSSISSPTTVPAAQPAATSRTRPASAALPVASSTFTDALTAGMVAALQSLGYTVTKK